MSKQNTVSFERDRAVVWRRKQDDFVYSSGDVPSEIRRTDLSYNADKVNARTIRVFPREQYANNIDFPVTRPVCSRQELFTRRQRLVWSFFEILSRLKTTNLVSRELTISPEPVRQTRRRDSVLPQITTWDIGESIRSLTLLGSCCSFHQR